MKHRPFSQCCVSLLVPALLSTSMVTVAWAGNLFSGPINSPAGHYPWALAAGDFNGDHIVDLAVTNNNQNPFTHSQVKVLLSKGEGTFQKPAGYAVGHTPQSLAVGDFNGDGKPDLVVVNHNKVSVLLGNGGGTFQPQVIYNVGKNPRRVAVGDFNGDGKLDFAVTKEGKPGIVSIMLGNGDGTFQPKLKLKIPAGHNPSYIVVGDLNGDGKPDLVVAATTPKYATTALLGNGDGSFRVAWTISNRMAPSGIVLGDFNGDGKLDMAESYGDPSRLTIRFGNGDGTFRDGTHSTFGDGLGPIAVGDFDGDGKLDLAVVGEKGVTVLLGRGDGTFLTEGTYALKPVAIAIAMITADVSNDGKPDLIVTDHFNQVVSVLLNTGRK